MTKSLQNKNQIQEDIVFDEIYDENGNFSQDKLETYLRKWTNGTSKFAIQGLVAWMPLYILLILIIIRFVN